MFLDDASDAVKEEVRIYGHSPSTGMAGQCGYHATEPPRIFLLKPGEELPAGWYRSPAFVPASGGDAVNATDAIVARVPDPLPEQPEPVTLPKRRGRPPKVRTNG